MDGSISKAYPREMSNDTSRSLPGFAGLSQHPYRWCFTLAQAFMSRRLRSSIPISRQRLKPETINHNQFQHSRIEQQQNQKKFFDKNSKSLSPLKKGDTVRLKKDPTSPWVPATVYAKHDTREATSRQATAVDIGEIGSTWVKHMIYDLTFLETLNSTTQTNLKQT